MRWLLITFVAVSALMFWVSKENFQHNIEVQNGAAFHNHFGEGYGTNFLYSNTNATVRVPSEYNEVMNACKRGCFNFVRYKPPNNFLHTHEAQQTEQAWCLNSCSAMAAFPYFGRRI